MQFITRTGTFSNAYDIKEVLASDGWLRWSKSGITDLLCQEIYDAYIEHLVNPTIAIKGIQFAQKATSGALSIDDHWPMEELDDFIYLQIYLNEKLKQLNYITQMSEIKLLATGEKSLIIYQKPSYKLPLLNEKSDQLFGNIHTELKMKDDQLMFFKIIVHRYNDFRFDTGRSFGELMEALFKSK